MQAIGVVGDQRRDERQIAAGREPLVGFQHALGPTARDEHVLVDFHVDGIRITAHAFVLRMRQSGRPRAIRFHDVPPHPRPGGHVGLHVAPQARRHAVEQQHDAIEFGKGVGAFQHVQAQPQAIQAVVRQDHEDFALGIHGR